MRHNRSRRGSNAIEFAFIAPLLLGLVGGVMDYSWFFHQSTQFGNAVRSGARAAAVNPDGQDPISFAEQALNDHLVATGFRGEVFVQASLMGAAPNTLLVVDAWMPYTPMVGLVTMPEGVSAVATLRLEVQPEEED